MRQEIPANEVWQKAVAAALIVFSQTPLLSLSIDARQESESEVRQQLPGCFLRLYWAK